MKTIEQWQKQLESVMVEGIICLVDSNSMQKKLLPDAIAWAEYPKNHKGLEVNHSGIAHTAKSGLWLISEEKRLIGGVADTTLKEYLESGCNILFRAPKKKLTAIQAGLLDEKIHLQSGNYRYRAGGLLTELGQQLRLKLIGKNKEVDYKSKDGIYICSEWSYVALNYATGIFGDWKGKSPKDQQDDTRLVDVALWLGQERILYIYS